MTLAADTRLGCRGLHGSSVLNTNSNARKPVKCSIC